MMQKIIHISDIHIPNTCEKRPYNEMINTFLDTLYEKEIKDNDPENIRIIVVGDVFHNKIKTTNEAQSIFHTLLNKCNSFCKTYIIAGNHDMLENNQNRMDSINPTFEIDNVYPNIIYLDKDLGFKSGYKIDDNIVLMLYCMHDSFAPVNILHSDYPDKAFIGLYHGDIVGSLTDLGRKSDNGIDCDMFKECDCVMAGHIHKRQEIIINDKTPFVYAGSLFQQDAGEKINGHGYEVWNLPSLSHHHVEVNNNYRIFKFKVNSYEDFKEDRETLINI